MTRRPSPVVRSRTLTSRPAAWVVAAVGWIGACGATPSLAQNTGIITGSTAPGVRIDVGGTVSRQEIDERAELAGMRERAKAAMAEGKNAKAGFVSLPKAFAAARAAVAAGKPVPDDVKYLGGLTRIDVVLVYPEANDLVVGGPAEPVHVVDEHWALGKRTGRPVMRLDDLVVAMRVVRDVRGGTFGCRLDPDPAAPARISAEMARLARGTRAERVKAVQQATGPQKVSFFGRVPDDTRFALAILAADYELKRYGLGLARTAVAGLGNGVDNTRQAVNMWWFELAYDPIMVSPAGDAFGLRGPRLKVMAGSFNWDPKGATPKAFDFAKRMTKSIEALAVEQPLVAELQNLADLSVVAALIQRERLDRKAGWDADWLLNATGDAGSGSSGTAGGAGYSVPKVTTPKNADALANYTNGSIAAGGVQMNPAAAAGLREVDGKNALDPIKRRADALRKDTGEAAVLLER